MTVSTLLTRQTYDGDGATVLFAIPFDFKSGEASAITNVLLIDELIIDATTRSGLKETLLVEGIGYTLDPAGPTPANVKTDGGSAPFTPTTDEKIRVERRTPRTQATDFDAGGPSSPYNPTNTEDAHDKLTRLLQEASEDIIELEAQISVPASATISGAAIPDWTPATNFLKDQVIIDKDTPSNKIYRALSDHLSGGTFNGDLVAGKWELLPNGADGADGTNGTNGANGINGTNGTNGANGADGADGIFSAIASQAEAEAGIETTKGMNSLRTKQAIAFQVPNLTVITDALQDISDNAAAIQILQNQVTNLISFAEFAVGKFAGSQKIVNALAVPQELLGLLAPIAGEGRGDKFLRDGDGTEFAFVRVHIRRENSLGVVRQATFDIIMQYNPITALWLIGRVGTVQLDATLELDGVILSVATDGGTKEGQLSYITNDMGGTAPEHFEKSRIQWWGQEIPKGT